MPVLGLRTMTLAFIVAAEWPWWCVLMFGPDEKEMNNVPKELELDGFELKTEKEAKDVSCDFLGINVTQTENEQGQKTVKLTQLGLMKKFLECVQMTE